MTISEPWGNSVQVTRTELNILLKCLVSMAASDRQLHQKEVDVLQLIVRQFVGQEVSESTIQETYEDILATQKHPIRDYLSTIGKDIDAEMKELIIKSSYLMMISDGKVVDHETEELAEIAAHLGVEDDRLVQLIREMNASS